MTSTQELERDVALEILSDPQSYSFDTVRSAGRKAASIIANLEAQLAKAKELNDRLHRRCQIAENAFWALDAALEGDKI